MFRLILAPVTAVMAAASLPMLALHEARGVAPEGPSAMVIRSLVADWRVTLPLLAGAGALVGALTAPLWCRGRLASILAALFTPVAVRPLFLPALFVADQLSVDHLTAPPGGARHDDRACS